MSVIKDLLMQDLSVDGKTPSHLEKEMHEQMIIMRKQMKAIKQILEGCNNEK